MKVTVDTNILIRAVVRDDEQQGEAAATLLRQAELIVVSLPCLCEFVLGAAPGLRLRTV